MVNVPSLRRLRLGAVDAAPMTSGLFLDLIGIVLANIENPNPLDRIRTAHHFRFGERTAGIVVTALPVLFHRSPGEFEILGDTFVASGAVDEVDDVANFLVCLPLQYFCMLTVPKLIRKLLHEFGECDTKLL